MSTWCVAIDVPSGRLANMKWFWDGRKAEREGGSGPTIKLVRAPNSANFENSLTSLKSRRATKWNRYQYTESFRIGCIHAVDIWIEVKRNSLHTNQLRVVHEPRSSQACHSPNLTVPTGV